MPRHVFFDLDGTLTDPFVGITASIRYALAELGETVPEPETLTWCIGPPLLGSFERLVGRARAPRALELYRSRFADVGLYENTLYPGIPETLARLGDTHLLHVASSKPRVFVERIVEHFGIREAFEGVYGSELDGTRVDKSELLEHALARSGASADLATMVGDRKHDGIGAARNGLAFVGVLYGYGSADELESAGAQVTVTAPEELVAVIR